MTKNQGNSARVFGETYLSNCLAKLLQDRIKSQRVGALKVSTDFKFLCKKFVNESFIACFNFSPSSC